MYYSQSRGARWLIEKTKCVLKGDGIHYQHSAPITPQHNGVTERKNGTLQEMARVMIHAKKVSKFHRAEAINTAY